MALPGREHPERWPLPLRSVVGGAIMTGKNVTRVELCAAVYGKAKLSRSEASAIVDLVLDEIANTLATGETVKLSSFGSFIVRKKNHSSVAIRGSEPRHQSHRAGLWCSNRPPS